MSYARVGSDSDVYVYREGGGEYRCYCGGQRVFTTSSAKELLEHLEKHLTYGDKVPEYALSRLKKEISEAGP